MIITFLQCSSTTIAFVKSNWTIFPSLVLERIAAVTQEPFPVLTHLRLSASVRESAVPLFPEELSGGSSPHLRSCEVWGVGISRIWKLLSSANHLVDLRDAQSRSASHDVSFPSISPRPGEPTTTPGDPHCRPRSYRLSIERRQRVYRRPSCKKE